MQKEKELVRVACRHAGGIAIRLWKAGPDDGGGKNPMIEDGPKIHLIGPSPLASGTSDSSGHDQEPGITLVEREWIDKWLEQNKQTILVAEHFVYVVDDEKPEEQKAAE